MNIIGSILFGLAIVPLLAMACIWLFIVGILLLPLIIVGGVIAAVEGIRG